jgi:branched-chain amino acid transport system ATP-binding protein
MLKIKNIEIAYQNALILRGISLEVSDKDIVAFLGPNGAGKSTTLKTISGTLRYHNGQIRNGTIEFEGQPIHQKEPHEIVKMGLIQVPEGRQIFSGLTVYENLRVAAYTRNDSDGIRQDYRVVMNYFPILRERLRRRAGYLSGGEQQMLAIGRALMSRPKLILSDEPSLGLAPLLVHEIFEILKRINRESGTSILLVEQNAEMALSISSHGYIIENGRIVMDDDSSKLKENPNVRELYLGLKEDFTTRNFSELKHYKERKSWLP